MGSSQPVVILILQKGFKLGNHQILGFDNVSCKLEITISPSRAQ